jgi:phosphomevalonate kinase
VSGAASPTSGGDSSSNHAFASRLTASAPGKLLLAGEYAVLDGATAVVIAVDRRATARRAARQPSPFLDALAAQLARRHGAHHPCAQAATANIAVDTAEFSRGGQKLGLGSSAAATVAAAALALAATDPTAAALDRDAVFELAFAAHGDAQGQRGSRGSGADIAAATYGGVLTYRTRTDASPEPGIAPASRGCDRAALPVPQSVTLLPFFTGHSADTVTMVARVHAARAAGATRASLEAIAAAALALAEALQRDDASAILRAIRQGGAALAALGEAAGHDLETAAVRAARAALARFGGAAKTTGAGGGDLAIAVLPREEDRNAATAALIEAGCQVVPLAIDRRGVDLAAPPL